MSKSKSTDAPVVRKRGWATGYPITQQHVKAISMDDTLIYLMPVGDYNIAKFLQAVEVLRDVSYLWTHIERDKQAALAEAALDPLKALRELFDALTAVEDWGDLGEILDGSVLDRVRAILTLREEAPVLHRDKKPIPTESVPSDPAGEAKQVGMGVLEPDPTQAG